MSNVNRQGQTSTSDENVGSAIAEQTEMSRRALNYRGRFGSDENRDPKAAQRDADISRAQGNR